MIWRSVLLIIVVFLGRLTQAQNWSSVRPGIELRQGTFSDQGTSVPFVLLRIDPKRRSIEVIDTFHTLSKDNAFAEFSIGEVMAKTGAFAVANAGSTKSFSFPAPAGLLIVKGKLMSRTNAQTPHGGILCLTRGKVAIVPTSSIDPICTSAVQRGPLLPPNFRSLAGSWKERAERTISAVDTEGHLLIMVTRMPATLISAASFLYSPESMLNVQSALNLDGSGSSGLILRSTEDGANKSSEPQVTVGTTNGLVASALAIF